MNRTLILCKPDAVERGYVGEILGRFEAKGLKIAAMRMLTVDAELAGQHYAEHAGKPFYDGLVEFIGRSPAVAAVIEGARRRLCDCSYHDGRNELSRGSTGHRPWRSQRRVHREPRARLRQQ